MTEEQLLAENKRLEEAHAKALAYENLRNACGYVGNGTHQSVKIAMTEDLSRVRVTAGNRSVTGDNLSEALSNYEAGVQVLNTSMIEQKAEAFDHLTELFAIAAETGQELKIGEDDATEDFTVHIGREWSYGMGLLYALENAVRDMKPSAPAP